MKPIIIVGPERVEGIDKVCTPRKALDRILELTKEGVGDGRVD